MLIFFMMTLNPTSFSSLLRDGIAKPAIRPPRSGPKKHTAKYMLKKASGVSASLSCSQLIATVTAGLNCTADSLQIIKLTPRENAELSAC